MWPACFLLWIFKGSMKLLSENKTKTPQVLSDQQRQKNPVLEILGKNLTAGVCSPYNYMFNSPAFSQQPGGLSETSWAWGFGSILLKSKSINK